MKHLTPILFTTLLIVASCTSQKKLAYLNNLPEPDGEETFTMDIPDYKLQPRDILYITAKTLDPDGEIKELLSSGISSTGSQDVSGGYLSGYVVDKDGYILIPTVGAIKVDGLTLDETRKLIQASVERVFKNSTVECKLQSFKITVIGEVNNPGTTLNYTNFLTVFEAIGKAGGINDYGDRTRILIIRPIDKITKTFRINLQDKQLITSQAYFLLPNDVVIVQPISQKIFNMNTPTISFIISAATGSVSMALLLINYLAK